LVEQFATNEDSHKGVTLPKILLRSATATMPLEALFFDVFGTCVDWRKTVTEGLIEAAKEAGNTTMVGPLSPQVQSNIPGI
jgi:hypothetical protein